MAVAQSGDEIFAGLLKDISASGCAVVFPNVEGKGDITFRTGNSLDLEIEDFGNLRGEVVRVFDSGIGISFEENSVDETELISQIMLEEDKEIQLEPTLHAGQKKKKAPKRILLVEDSKFFAKLIKTKVELETGFKVTSVETMAEAGEAIEKERDGFFLGLIDLVLPDAPKGEIIDYVLELGLPIIVFTGEYNDQVREDLMSKNIIDYVVKNAPSSLSYIIKTINELSENHNIDILVVEDSKVTRKLICNILRRHKFNVHEAADGAEGLEVLSKEPGIKLVVTDFNMPVMDGFELTSEIRREFSDRRVGIIGLSTQGDNSLSAKFIKNGADDFILKPFIEEEFICRISNNVRAIRLLEETEVQAERVRALVDTAVDAIVTIDQLGTIETFNPSAEVLFGYKAGEIIGKNVKMLMPEPYQSSHDGYLKSYMDGGDGTVIGVGREVVALKKDGTKFPIHLSVGEMRLGNQRMFAGIITDISVRKSLESQVKENLDRVQEAHDAMKADLEAAEDLQQSLLPEPIKIIGNVEFSSVFVPSAYLAGDIFNYFRISDDRIAFFIIDVSGHGVPSALLSVSLANLVTANMIFDLEKKIKDEKNRDVSSSELTVAVVSALNERFQLDDATSLYFTAAFGVIDTHLESISLCLAGHPNPILFTKGKSPSYVGEGGVPVGFIPEPGYEATSLPFKPGDRMVIYTDGITECENSEGEQWGEESFVEFLKKNRKSTNATTIRKLQVHLEKWHGGDVYDDDISLVAIDMKD